MTQTHIKTALEDFVGLDQEIQLWYQVAGQEHIDNAYLAVFFDQEMRRLSAEGKTFAEALEKLLSKLIETQ